MDNNRMFMPVPENPMFTDDVKLVADMLRSEWSLGIGRDPSIAYKVDEYMMDSRYGSIFVYIVNRSNKISSVDYRTFHRTVNISLKITAPIREYFMEIVEEVYRVLVANRRASDRLRPYTFLEIINERPSNDLSGWYSTTISIKLTGYAVPIRSAGFGDEVNQKIDAPVNMYEEPPCGPQGPWMDCGCPR